MPRSQFMIDSGRPMARVGLAQQVHVALPQVQRIDRSDAEAIINAIIKDGCCIIKNFTDQKTVDTVNQDVKPYLEADKPWKVGQS